MKHEYSVLQQTDVNNAYLIMHRVLNNTAAIRFIETVTIESTLYVFA